MENTNQIPEVLEELIKKAQEINFEMSTDYLTGELLQTIAASKPNGHFLNQKKYLRKKKHLLPLKIY